jgi:hypothetical protein
MRPSINFPLVDQHNPDKWPKDHLFGIIAADNLGVGWVDF